MRIVPHRLTCDGVRYRDDHFYGTPSDFKYDRILRVECQVLVRKWPLNGCKMLLDIYLHEGGGLS